MSSIRGSSYSASSSVRGPPKSSDSTSSSSFVDELILRELAARRDGANDSSSQTGIPELNDESESFPQLQMDISGSNEEPGTSSRAAMIHRSSCSIYYGFYNHDGLLPWSVG